ncbi:MAG TPA: SUMF1/EgtB/PvdO family nonheme iron enzyme [Solirubrobacteraceae bacterium]|jgi:iron(II)-dependent oxidoreductase|nr:SUMF1/EgtB/PvdO family nonheme iron enzyme [Solirubrobacteraceae bacterium]
MASTVTATHHAATPSPEEQVLAALSDARARTLALVSHLSEEQLTAVHSPIMSPLAWDLGHIAAYEDLWLAHRLAGLELLRPDLVGVYDAFETPRAVRGDVEALGPADARAYMREVRDRVAETIARAGVGDGGDDVCEMVIRHELQHSETMRQTLAIAGLLPAGEPPPLAAEAPSEQDEWLELPAGSFAMGAGAEGFAYDNERPRHTVALGAYAIARRPVTAASWMRFAEGGGYERREWWSDEGWAWKEEYDITHHPRIATGEAAAPACHVSWFEADAFARAHDARLPSEAEWERAATWGQPTDGRGGSAASDPTPVVFAQVGRVWEWTASAFGGYPGFVAHPYREYSEVFFGEDHRVLRGGSWATSPRVQTVTFRNWDLPQRRQIFAGVRLARDAS